MKKFNKEITVSVSVDAIAGELLEGMHPEFKHRELVAEAMIATSLDKGTIGHIYNSLNGHMPDINFKVGDVIMCTSEANIYREVEPQDWKREYREIGECKIVDVNPYASYQICVEYNKFSRNGEDDITQEWVSKEKCKMIPPADVTTACAEQAQ